jgi:hypothetical protein
MTIATLMATSAIFLVKGWTAPAYGALAITVGGAVCIAASNSGDTSQDLKTGYLIGATPRLQQIALMIGVCVSTLIIGVTLTAMNTAFQEFRAAPQAWDINAAAPGVNVQQNAKLPEKHPCHRHASKHHRPRRQRIHRPQRARLAGAGRRQIPLLAGDHQIEVQWIQGIGSEKAAAPQARLMATVINGILTQKLPWGLVLMGVFLVIAVELLGIRSLSFAVGAYLSIGTTLAIFRRRHDALLVDMALEKGGSTARESEISPGALYASGLIAAGGIVGLIGVAIKAYESLSGNHVPIGWPHTFLFPEIPYLHSDGTAVVDVRGAGVFALLLRPQAVEAVSSWSILISVITPAPWWAGSEAGPRGSASVFLRAHRGGRHRGPDRRGHQGVRIALRKHGAHRLAAYVSVSRLGFGRDVRGAGLFALPLCAEAAEGEGIGGQRGRRS